MNQDQSLKTVPKYLQDRGIKQIVGLDFETFYSVEHSLTKLSTTEYVRSKEFYTQGVGIRTNSDPETTWYKSDSVREALADIKWEETAVLCHNAHFDGFILSQHYGEVPAYYLDTRAMARGVLPHHISAALDAVGERLGLGRKIEGVLGSIKGFKYLTGVQSYLLGQYCQQDVDLMWAVFMDILPDFPEEELDLIDLTVRMYADPMFEGDCDIAREELTEIRKQKTRVLQSVCDILDIKEHSQAKLLLSSNAKFSSLLEAQGATPPTKWSEAQQKDVPALAKSDLGFQALVESDDPRIKTLCEARLEIKSTIGEKRAERFISHSQGGKLPIMLNMYGAHTQRWSGGDKFNPQNFPRTSRLKDALKSPLGFKVMVIDSAQIEARCLAFLAGQEDLLDEFRDPTKDPYKTMAASIYSKQESEVTKAERFVGKVCLAEGSLILSNRGWIKIETLQPSDTLWDGDNWECHQGLQNNGLKPTLQLSQLELTPDHLVWSGTNWLQSQYLVQDANTRSRALVHAAENLPSLGTSWGNAVEQSHLLSNAPADSLNTALIITTLKISSLLDAMYVLKPQPLPNATGNTQLLCPMTNIELDSLTDYPQQLAAAITRKMQAISITEPGEFMFIGDGAIQNPSSWPMFNLSPVGITQILRWTEQIITKATNQEILTSARELKTQLTNAKSLYSKMKSTVYDVLSVGPKNRFLALTADGPLIVHNCVLGLGYGMGAEKLQNTLASGAMGMVVDLTQAEAERAKTLYRTKNDKIVKFWKQLEEILSRMIGEKTTEFCGMTFHPDAVMMPNGLHVFYPELNGIYDEERDSFSSITYRAKLGRTNLYGGKFAENIVQSYARSVVAAQILEIAKKYRVVLAVHDECVFFVPDDEVEEATSFALRTFRTAPTWAAGIPLDAEVEVDDHYAK